MRAALDAAVAGLARGADAAAAEQASSPEEQASSAGSSQLGLQVSPLPRWSTTAGWGVQAGYADPLHAAGSMHRTGRLPCACTGYQHACSLGAARCRELAWTAAELWRSCPGVVKAVAVMREPVQGIVELLAELWGASSLPGRYARAALAELVASAQAHGLPAAPAAHLLDLRIAVQLGLGPQVRAFVRCLCPPPRLCLGSLTTPAKPVPACCALPGSDSRPTLQYGRGQPPRLSWLSG